MILGSLLVKCTILVKLALGINFTNIVCKAFMLADSECAKNTDSLQVFLKLLGSLLIKADQKLLVKLIPGVNFTNILRTAFILVDPERVKNTINSSVSFYTFGICKHKSCS